MATEDIVVGYAKIWYAPTGEADPDETSVAYGADWGGNWTYLGDTLEPLTMATEVERLDIEIQQSTAPVKQNKIKEIFRLNTTMAEHTGTLLNLLFGGTLTATAAGASQKGFDSLVFGGETDIDIYKWGFESLYKDASNNQHPIRYFFHKGSIALNGDVPFDKGAPTGIPIQITILTDTTQSIGEQIGTTHIVKAAATS